VDHAPADVAPAVLPGQEEPQQLGRGGVAAEAQHDAHAIAHGGVGGGEQRGAGADAHRDDHGGHVARGQDGHDGLHVVGPQPAPREAADRRHRHVEAGPS